MFANGNRYRVARFVVVLICATGLLCFPLHAQIALSKRVLVVYNSTESASAKVAKYYIEKRGIPVADLCRISPPSTALLSWSQYVASVKAPVQKCLNAVGPQNILYIVFSYQTPYAVSGSSGALSYSLDQYVADIWDQYATQDADPMPRRFHPYYDDAQSQGNAYQPFVSH